MTLEAKRGVENVLRSMKHFIAGESVADIAAINAATSATLQAYLKGSYTFDGSKTISIVRNNAETALTYTPDAGTYTATELAALLNSDETFHANVTADAVQSGAYLQIYETTRGTAGSLKASDTTGNAVLGWTADYTANYYPLRDFVEVAIQYENVEPVAYPAVHLRCDDVMPSAEFPEMVDYNVALRVYEVAQDAGFGEELYVNLARYARMLNELLAPDRGSRSMGGQVNSVYIDTYSPARSIEANESQYYRAYVDFTLTVTVQED